MGERGPLPKRSESRQRRNTPERETTKAAGARHVSSPRADGDWHPIARRLWNAATRSGQADFYEPSDWAVLYSLMDDLTYYKNGNKRSGQMLATIMSSLSSLLLTEGDRRRLQIELSRPSEGDDADPDVAVMDRWRQKLGS